MDELQLIFDEFVEKYQLNLKLSFEMPKSYEFAFGTFDNCTNTVFINFSLLKNSKVKLFFNLFHELRHAMQFQKTNLFSSWIKKTLLYVIMWDGLCMKFENGLWHECKLLGDEEYFTDCYLTLPYEIDANEFAFKQTKQIISKKDFPELCNLFQSTKPKKVVSQKELENIFRKIDQNTK